MHCPCYDAQHYDYTLDKIINCPNMETRSTNIFEIDMDKRTKCTLEALALLYWNEWETACRFEDSVKQNVCMRRISMLQDMITELEEDVLGR